MSDSLIGRSLIVEAEATPLRLRHYPNAASAIFLFSSRLLVAVIQLRLVDKYWGGAYTGLNALSNQVLMYVTLLELGLSQSAITLMYEPILKRNHPRISALVSAVRHDVRIMTAVGGVLVLPVLALFAHFIHGTLSFWTVAGTMWLIAATGLLQLAAVHFQVYLNAAERLDKVNYTLAGGYLLKTIIGLPLAIHWHNYLLLPATIALLTIGEFFCLKLGFHGSFPEFRKASWREEAGMIRSRAKFVVIHKVAGLAYYQSDYIILSLTMSLQVVKNYAKFQYVSAALLSVVGLVAASLTTSIARLQIRHGAADRRHQYATAQFVMSLIGGVLMLGFWFTAPTVVKLAFGNDPAIGRTTIALFGIALFLNIVKTTDDVFIMAKGAFEVGYWIPVVEIPIYIVSGVLLSRRIGFAGILLASIGTNLFVSILLKGIVLARPVFDSTHSQWYANRLLSMAKALLLLSPLVCLYALAPSYLHPAWLRFLVTNVIALIYLLAGLRYILSRALVGGAATQ
jgi:O-antigen/teichoic acid export membrane protein